MMVDPLGMASGAPLGQSDPSPPVDPLADIKARFPTINIYLPGGSLFNAGNMSRNSMMEETLIRQEVLKVLYALDNALGSLGYESASISTALGRSTSTAGEAQGNDQYDNNVGGDRTKDGVKGTRVSQTFGELEFNYSVFNDGTLAGLWVFAIYRGDVSKYKKTDWIQSVYTNSGGKATLSWFNDYKEDPDKELYGVANPPFYYARGNSDRLRSIRDSEFGGRTFNDRPNRAITGRSVAWFAELSLVGYREGRWETIANVFYGFHAKNGIVNILLPVTYTGIYPSPNQQSLINNAKRP